MIFETFTNVKISRPQLLYTIVWLLGKPGNQVARTYAMKKTGKNLVFYIKKIMTSHIKSYARERVIYDK